MSKTQYDIYISNNVALVRSLILKSDLTASAINRGLSELGFAVNENDPSSWKYYLNLSGQYHYTDKPMSIVSLDTLQTIDFTKDNLQLHDSTRREYSNQTHYYQELVNRFPEQESLIRGVLTPIDLNAAIGAADGTILHYDTSLVEENETNLIPNLQDWIDKFNLRWHNKSYALVDDLYPAAQLGVLFTLLPSVVDNLRIQNCHTRFAHTYHIRSFLASQGRLDVFIDFLTKKQMLWLYRNIRYIHRNAGRRETFQRLLENLLTQRGFPLAEWTMRHDLSQLLTNIYPKIEFERTPLNFGFSSAGLDTRDIPNMLDMEVDIAKGNPIVQSESETNIRILMENAPQDRLSTKILESSVLDMSDASPFTLSDALLNYWLYFSFNDQYPAIVTFDNPKTGGTLSLGMKDAFIIFLYAYNKARGVTLPNVPIVDAWMIRRHPTPSRNELLGLMEPRYNRETYVTEALRDLAPVGLRYVSTSMFNESVVNIHNDVLKHRWMYATCEHMTQRGQIEQMVLRLYRDVRCDLSQSQTYLSWFSERGLDIQNFTYVEADLLATQLLERCTGADLKKTKSLREIQAAMLRLMSRLSSYSIQYLQSINNFPVRTVDWGAIRVGDDQSKASSLFQVDAIDCEVMDCLTHGERFLPISHVQNGPVETTYIRGHASMKIDIPLNVDFGGILSFNQRAEISVASVLNVQVSQSNLQDPTDLNTLNYQPIALTPLSTALVTTTAINTTLTSADHTAMQSR